MPSNIDPTIPVDEIPAVKGQLRSNFQAAKDEIEELQTGKADLPLPVDVTPPATLGSSHYGKNVRVLGAGAVTLPADAPTNTTVWLLRVYAAGGAVTFTAASGASIGNVDGHTAMRDAQWASAALWVESNVGGSAAKWFLIGDTA